MMPARRAFNFYLASSFPPAQGFNRNARLFGGFTDADFHPFLLHKIDIKVKKSVDIIQQKPPLWRSCMPIASCV
jgi:hypothetical protein